MIVQSVHYAFAPENSDKAAALFRELRDASRREAGVITFDVVRGRDNPALFALYEEYRDQAALDAHSASDHFQRLVINGVRPMATHRDFVAGDLM
jgi:(4S)-4-hydroxy-5-phosphonooxypentane-2,3-dione isomerase